MFKKSPTFYGNRSFINMFETHATEPYPKLTLYSFNIYLRHGAGYYFKS